MNTTLLVNITGETWNRVDIFEDIPITVIFQQSDLTDLTARRVPYSKVIQIPDTSNNALVFEHYYEVNGLDFNPLNKVGCVVQYRGTDVFRGTLRLNAVVQKSGSRLYEVFILGDVADWASQVRDYTLQQLDWYDLQHDITYSAVTQSWEADEGDVNGLFGGAIIYPLIDYGIKYDNEGTSAQTPTFVLDYNVSKSFSLSGSPVTIDTFKPAVRLKEVIERIFDKTDFTLVSDFFDSDYFRALYMDTFQNGKIGIETSEEYANQNIFKVYTTSEATTLPPTYTANGSALQIYPISFQTLNPDGYDPLGNFTLGSVNQLSPSYFRAPYTGTYAFNFRFGYQNPNFVLGNATFYIIANKSTSLSNLQTSPSFYLAGPFTTDAFGQRQYEDLYFSTTANFGEYISLYILIDPSSAFGSQIQLTSFNYAGITTPAPMWDLYDSPQVSDLTVDLSLGITNMNSFDFIRGLITMFNLVIIQDEAEKTIRIEPYNWYYNNADRTVQDWTSRVDLDEDYVIEPLSFDLSKEVVWTALDGGFEFLNYTFFNQKDYVFGRYKYISTNTLLTNSQEYQIPFGAVPTSGMTGAPNFIIPKFYYLNDGSQNAYSQNPHIFFWVGNRWSYLDSDKTIPGYWYLASGSTPVIQTTYPCVSHLSSLDVRIPQLVADINFQSTFDFFGNSNNQILQFSPYSLYNLWWSDYIDNIYSPETRRLTCRVFFNPILVYETSLRDVIFIKDANYTIERINEADLVNRKLTEVSLIKDRVPYYKFIPPAPFYSLSGNTPYPTPQPFYISASYVSLDLQDVCDSSAPILSILTFGGPTFNDFDVVYYDTGTSYQKPIQGTYIRQTTSSDVFVVIDNYGRIIQTNC